MIGGRDQNEEQRALLKSTFSKLINEGETGIVVVVHVDDRTHHLTCHARRTGKHRDPVVFGDMVQAVVFALADQIRQDRARQGPFTEVRSDDHRHDEAGWKAEP